MDKITTIGVYGYNEVEFFQAISDAKVEVFCDIRLRRGMRGSLYAFVNSNSLQKKLKEMGIQYIHIKDLAPNQNMRKKQKKADEIQGITKRNRITLSQDFIFEYEIECLSHFNVDNFIESIGPNTHIICFFCVESQPEACHRYLTAEWLAKYLTLPIEHLRPPVI